MKNLLIVAYYFPPSGGPGVQRVLKHVKYLPEFGWNPIVLTVSNGQYPAIDTSLIEQIPKSTEVIKTRIFEPYDVYRKLTGKGKGTAIDVNVIKKDNQKSDFKESLAEFVRATFFIPDARMFWYFRAKKAIDEIMKTRKIDAVYSSSPPYTCSLIARYTKRKYGIPWVAGFRDPWTEFISSPKRWWLPRAIDRSMEHSVFATADAVECAWVGIIKDALGKYPDLDRSKFHHVPNGFDSADYPKVDFTRNERFTVTYTGSMYGRRNPSSLFSAVEMLIRRGDVNPKELCFRFVGRFGTEVEEMFSQASFRDSIDIVGYVPHHESIASLMRSDALLLVVDESKESEEIVPGKVYEYIGCRRPIIAIAPQESAIAELIRETGAGKVAHQSETEKIADIFLSYYKSWRDGNSSVAADPNAINKYERRESAKTLAQLLDGKIVK
jgi:glycosyltransferase involved in cell wall biosynthesis